MQPAAPQANPAPLVVPQRKRGWWPLAGIASAHLMAVLDTTIMFVALPSVQHGLGMTVSARQWVVTAYTLSLAGLLLTARALQGAFGAVLVSSRRDQRPARDRGHGGPDLRARRGRRCGLGRRPGHRLADRRARAARRFVGRQVGRPNRLLPLRVVLD